MKKFLKHIIFLLIVVALSIIINTIYSSFSITEQKNILPYIPQKNNDSAIENMFSKDLNIKELKLKKYKNEDIIARLEIPNLFNILITQTNNNEYYLTHSITKEKDEKGNEYLDYRVTKDNNQINIYGHNSKTYNLPFSKLEKFLEKDFFDKNKYILLQFEKERRIYEIMSIKEVSNDYSHMKVSVKKEQFKNHIASLISNSINERKIKYDEESNILVLQTCSYNKEKSYYIIVALEINREIIK